jgi:hypothetical protein
MAGIAGGFPAADRDRLEQTDEIDCWNRGLETWRVVSLWKATDRPTDRAHASICVVSWQTLEYSGARSRLRQKPKRARTNGC